MGPRVCLNAVVKRTKFHLFHRRELSPDRLSRSLVSILTELSQTMVNFLYNHAINIFIDDRAKSAKPPYNKIQGLLFVFFTTESF